MIRTWMFVLFFFCVSFAAQASPFKILTWNVYMLPKPVKFSNQQVRMKLIANKLLSLDHDIVVLQEAFSDDFRSTIKNRLLEKYPYQTVLGKSGYWKHVMNSGLMILSRFPITRTGYDFYHTCAKADCFSSKGVLTVNVQIEDQVIQLAATHLQSGQKYGISDIRTTQLSQIKELLNSQRTRGVPQILIGDLNINALQGREFSNALSMLDMTSTPLQGYFQSTKAQLTNCLGQREKFKAEWLDHMLVRSNNSSLISIEKRVFLLQDFVNGKWCDLSDHYPVEGTFSI